MWETKNNDGQKKSFNYYVVSLSGGKNEVLIATIRSPKSVLASFIIYPLLFD